MLSCMLVLIQHEFPCHFETFEKVLRTKNLKMEFCIPERRKILIMFVIVFIKYYKHHLCGHILNIYTIVIIKYYKH
jgi:hypothetical protein